MYEYTPTTSEVLYVKISYTVYCSGQFASQTSYKADVTVEEYAQVTNLNKISLDAAVFSKSHQEYFWAGNMKWPRRTEADYGIMMRNKQHGIAVTPDGIFRPMNKGNDALPDNWKLSGAEAEATCGGWGDISSTMAVRIESNQEYTATARDGFIIMTNSGNKKLYLPTPALFKGKWFFIKNLSYLTPHSGDAYKNLTIVGTMIDEDNCNIRSSENIGELSTIYISTGEYWVKFYCG